jgi:P4 family phage/plasmid primase-like protien
MPQKATVTPIEKYPGDGKPQNAIADMVAMAARPVLCIDPIDDCYYQRLEVQNVWGKIPKIRAEQLIEEFLGNIVSSYTASLLNSILRLLRSRIISVSWETNQDLIPMRNGVFDLRKGKLISYSKDRPFNWQLDFSYDPKSTCKTIDQWMTFVTDNDEELCHFILCWMSAILTGRYDLQKYLVITGHGGTGKGTLLRLIIQLIGKKNVWVTTAKRLEYNQYESSNLYGKRLTVITDAEDYAGELTVLKQGTGCDPLPYERKYKDPEEPFLYTGMFMILSNQPLSTSDKTSAIYRRQLVAQFNKIVPEKVKAENQNFEETLKSELPGLFNRLVSIKPKEVTRTLRHLSPSMASAKLKSELETNPVLAWAHERLIQCDSGQETPIGLAPVAESYAAPSKLYADFVLYCENQGSRPVSLRKFSRLVIDNCVARGIQTDKARLSQDGSRILSNLKLRTKYDDTNKTPYLFLTDSDGSLTDKTLASAGSDGSDGL